MSKVIQDCLGFNLLRSVISPENLRHSLNQSDANENHAPWSPAFSRALGSLHGFNLNSHWFLGVFSLILIGRCDNSGFGFTTLDRRAL